MKRFVPLLASALTVSVISVPTVSAEALTDDLINSRFEQYSPDFDGIHSISDWVEYQKTVFKIATDNAIDNLNTDIDRVQDYLNNKKFVGDLYNKVAEQRISDLVEYANSSTTPQNSRDFAFTAKRKVIYPDDTWEVDTMYYWYSAFTDLHSPTFEGVQISDFVLQPNSAFVYRQFSDGTYSVFTFSPQQLRAVEYGSSGFYINLNSGSVVTVYNSDGDAQSITIPSNYSVLDVYFFNAPTDSSNHPINSISSDYLKKGQAAAPTTYDRAFDTTWLTDIQCLLGQSYFTDTNGIYKPFFGSIYGTTLYDLKAPSLNIWYLSSGGFVQPSQTTKNLFNIDDTNISPSLPPATVTNNNIYNTPITNNNVSNYADYGVTYNSVSGEFELDADVLAGKVKGGLSPQFDPTFDGTYSTQPDIGLTFDTPLDFDYIQQQQQLVVDIQAIIDSLSPSPPWVAPTFPAVSTDPLVDYTFPVLPTETVPQNVIDDVGTFVNIGFDALDTLDITAIFIALAVLGAVAWYIWG